MLNRKFEDCRDDLAERIVRQSYNIRQKQSIVSYVSSLAGVVKATFSDLVLPNPAYVLPLVFALGVFMNITLGQTVDVNDYVDSIYLNL